MIMPPFSSYWQALAGTLLRGSAKLPQAYDAA
jgi:hypothetical protein